MQNEEVLKAKNQVDDKEGTEEENEEQSLIDHESGSGKENNGDNFEEFNEDVNENISAHENQEIYEPLEIPIRASTPDDRGDHDQMVNIDIYFFH